MRARATDVGVQTREQTPLWGLYPMVAVQLALFVVPIAIMFVYSFWTTENYQVIREWTFANYLVFFESWTYPSVLFRTLWTSVIITFVTLCFAYPFAYWIARYTKRWQKILLGAVVLSFWTSGLLRAYAWAAQAPVLLTVLYEDGAAAGAGAGAGRGSGRNCGGGGAAAGNRSAASTSATVTTLSGCGAKAVNDCWETTPQATAA